MASPLFESSVQPAHGHAHGQVDDARLARAGSEVVRYAPQDCVLCIGHSGVLSKYADALRIVELHAVFLCTDVPDASRLPSGLRAVSGRLADLTGWMGNFTASAHASTGPVDLASLSFHPDGHYDWILDFSTPRAHPSAVPPLGYYALPADDFSALKRSLLEIAVRKREGFEKPRYFQWNADLCAHRRQGVKGCSACVSVCATGAITSDKQMVRIEPNLCQGCGACSLVCPSGAVRYAHPGTASSLTSLQASLTAWRQAGGGQVGLWIVRESAENAAVLNEIPAGWLPYRVRESTSLGLEFWLAALVSGCNRVAIAAGEAPDESHRALEEQLSLGRAILTALAFPSSLGLATNAAELDALPAMPAAVPSELAVSDDKRTLLYAAVDALIEKAGASPVSIPLSAGPMGEVRIAADKCTLCAACVRICPTDALCLTDTTMQIDFAEQRCLQCGLCANVCPEKAVSLTPRLLTSKTARQTPHVVAEAEPFSCTGCGNQFATRAMIERSRAIVADHPMFQGEQARLMTLCTDCRQKAIAGVPA